MKPNAGPSGENGSQTPKAMTTTVVTISGQLARLCKKGIRFVRMTWMMSVCVSSDSTNQPVWNRADAAWPSGRTPAVEDDTAS